MVPPGIDLGRWTPGLDRVPGRRTRLLFVGRDFERKGGDTLFEAFARHLGSGYELDVVTRFPRPAPPGVRFHHELPANGDALRNLYARADIFVFPTHWDAFGIAVIEAMAAGSPVVATRLKRPSRDRRRRRFGTPGPPGDAAALAAAIADIASRAWTNGGHGTSRTSAGGGAIRPPGERNASPRGAEARRRRSSRSGERPRRRGVVRAGGLSERPPLSSSSRPSSRCRTSVVGSAAWPRSPDSSRCPTIASSSARSHCSTLYASRATRTSSSSSIGD